jgi:RHS repeat-associated protein
VVDVTAKPYRTLADESGAGTLERRYVYGAGLLADLTPTDTPRYFIYDGLGSTAAVTDFAGHDVAHLGYAAFGDTAIALGAADTRMGYVGRYGVEAAAGGLTFMRDRFYDAETGVFLSMDPEEGGERQYLRSTSYLYASANPALLVDPDGDKSWMPRWRSNRWTPRDTYEVGKDVFKHLAFPTVSIVSRESNGATLLRSWRESRIPGVSAETGLDFLAKASVISAGISELWGSRNANIPTSEKVLRGTYAAVTSPALGPIHLGLTIGKLAGIPVGGAERGLDSIKNGFAAGLNYELQQTVGETWGGWLNSGYELFRGRPAQ